MKKNNSHILKTKMQKGVSLVEVVIASAIISIATASLFASFGLMLSFSLRNASYLKATFLLEEGSEAVRFMRDYGWTSRIASLNNGTTYRFEWTSTGWTSTTSPSMIDSKFDRTVVFSAVNRDGSNNIVSSGGTLDTDSRKATISVAWMEGNSTTTKVLETYIFDTFNN